MRTANHLTFATYEASRKLKASDPIKTIFDNLDWSFIHPLAGTNIPLRERMAMIQSLCTRLSFSSIWARSVLIAS